MDGEKPNNHARNKTRQIIGIMIVIGLFVVIPIATMWMSHERGFVKMEVKTSQMRCESRGHTWDASNTTCR